jgi:hypothetical protein
MGRDLLVAPGDSDANTVPGSGPTGGTVRSMVKRL